MASISPEKQHLPRVVAFDIGRVLIQYDPYLLLRQLTPDETKIEYFLTHVCGRTHMDRLDAGEDRLVVDAELSTLFPDYADMIAQFRERWIETIPAAVAGTSEILFELKEKGVPVYAITNFALKELEMVKAIYPALRAFDGMIVSAAERLIKPDPAIFKLFLSRYNLSPADAVFTDDLPRNIEGARSVGMHGIVFENADQLRRDLKALGMPLA